MLRNVTGASGRIGTWGAFGFVWFAACSWANGGGRTSEHPPRPAPDCVQADQAVSAKVKAKIDDEDWRDLGSFASVLNGFGKARTYCRSGLTREALSEYQRVQRMLTIPSGSEH